MTITLSSNADLSAKLAYVLANRFDALLQSQSVDRATFKRFTDVLERYSLLTVRQESQFKPKEIELDQNKLDDARYRRNLIRKLKAPRPSKYVYHTLRIDIDRVAETDYRHAFAVFIGEGVARRLGDIGQIEAGVISQISPQALLRFLESHKAYEIDARIMHDYLMRTLAQEAIDNSPAFQNACRMIKAAADSARATFQEQWGAFCDQLRAEHAAASAVTLASINARADGYIAEIRAKQAVRLEAERLEREEAERIALANAGKTEQDLFYESVIKREKEWRQANRLSKKARAVVWTLAIATGGLLAAFLQVDGTTLVDVVREWQR